MKQGTLLHTPFAAYVVGEQIGQGGAGTVFRVKDQDSGIVFALKRLDRKKATRDKIKRFKNEILFGQTCRHQNLLQVVDYGVAEDGSPFYVMPFYERSLRTLINDGVTKDQALVLFAQLIDGLEAAHLLGVIHRDVKPENVLHDASGPKLVVADFGIASFAEDEMFTLVETSPQQRLANFQYCAPEQRKQGSVVTAAADVYALGLILNELFTAQVPHGTSYKLITTVAPEYGYLDPVVDEMLRQQPQSRPSIPAIKDLLISRRNTFVSHQKLLELKNTVVPASQVPEVDDAEIESIDYQGGDLIFNFRKPISPRWHQAFQTMSSFQYLMGCHPSSVRFMNSQALLRSPQGQESTVVEYFRQWLKIANRRQHELLAETAREHERLKQEELRQKTEAEARRLRVLSAIAKA